MHIFWLWRFLIQTHSAPSFPSGFPVQPRKELTPSTPWTLTRPVSSYLFFPALLVFSPVPLLFSSQASGAMLLLPTPNSWLLSFPQATKIPHTHSVKFQGQPHLFPYSLFQTTSSTSPGFFSCAQIKQLLGLRIKMLMRTQDRKTPWFQLRYQQSSLQEVSANTAAKISQSILIFQFLPDWPKWMIPPCKNTSTPYKFKILTPNQDDLNHPTNKTTHIKKLKETLPLP